MRIAILADVHSNLEAFEAVLSHAREGGPIDQVWSLGDIVGYGPDPGRCIELLHGLPHIAIAGNHDYAATGVIGTEEFNPYAAEAARWTAAQLGVEEQVWLSNLSAVHIEGEFTLVHGSLSDPVWDYLVSPVDAEQHLGRQTTPFGFVGHSHLPLLYLEGPTGLYSGGPGDGSEVTLKGRFVANPGGVGQPRDGDPRAAYCLLDTRQRRVTFHRVPYALEVTQAKMRAAGLPEYLASRLSKGR